MNNNNLKIQSRLSTTISAVGFAVVLVNIVRNLYFRGKSFSDTVLFDPSVLFVFIFALVLFLTRKMKSPVIQYLQILIFLANAALALLDEYDAFHGIGFLILTLLLAYRYDMLKRYVRLKLLFLAVFTIFFLELSIHFEGENQIGSSLNIVIYLVFFLSIIYLIYSSEINRILRHEKIFNRTISSMEAEKQKLLEEIEDHTSEIHKRELRIQEMEEYISAAELKGDPINLKEFNITQREEDVIREFCTNPHLTTKDLATNLNMSLGTIKSHFISIYKKLEIRSRSELLDKCKWNFK